MSPVVRRTLIGLAFGAVFLSLAVWGVPLDDLGEALANAELVWLGPVAVVFLVQQALRAWRQQVLVQALVPTSGWWGNHAVLCMSFFCINTLPARLGEFVRPYLLLEREGVPLGAGFGVVFAERIVDLLAVLAMLSLVLVWVDIPPEPIVVGGRSWEVVELGRTVGLGLFPPLLVVTAAIAIFGEPVVDALARPAETVKRVLRHRMFTVAIDLGLSFARSFSRGLAAVREPKRLAAVLALTALTWSWSGLMYVFLARAFGVEDLIGWAQGIGVMVITMLGTLVPAPPGFAGVYEAFARGALELFGLRGGELAAKALAFALVIHWWQYGVQALTAFYFFITERVSFTALAARARAGAVLPEPTDPRG